MGLRFRVLVVTRDLWNEQPRFQHYSMLDPIGWYLYFFPSQKRTETVWSPPSSLA